MMKNEMKTNNKTVLLAILAVFAMIAAGTAVVMASESETDAANVNVTDATSTITAAGDYYVGSDMTITINKNVDGDATFYVLTGVEVVFKGTAGNLLDVIVIQTKVAPTNGVLDDANALPAATVTVNDMVAAENLTYTAKLSNTNTNASEVIGKVTGIAFGAAGFKVASDGVLNSATVVDAANLTYNAKLSASGGTTETYFGDLSSPITMTDTDDTLLLKKGAATVTDGTNTIVTSSTFSSAAGVTVTLEGDDLLAKGTIAAGDLRVTEGTLNVANDDEKKLITTDDKSTVTGTSHTSVALTSHHYEFKNVAINAAIAADSEFVYGSYNLSSNLTAAFSFTVKGYSTLTIVQGKTLSLGNGTITVLQNGTLDVWGSLKGTHENSKVAGGAVGDGSVIIRQGSTVTGIGQDVTKPAIVELPASYTYNKQSGSITADTTVDNLVIDGTLTIDQGKTLTVTGMISLNSGKLEVNGKLVLGAGAQVGSTNTAPSTTQNVIVIGSKGSIQSEGTIAKNLPVRIATGDASYAEVCGISGLSFGYSMSGLVVSGTSAIVKDTFTAPVIKATGINISKDLTVSKDVKMHIAKSKLSSTLDVKGTLVLGIDTAQEAEETALTLNNGAEFTVSGVAYSIMSTAGEPKMIGKIDANVTLPGKDLLDGVAMTEKVTFVSKEGSGTVAGVAGTKLYVTGYTIEVVKAEYVDDDGNKMYYQHAYLSGAMNINASPSADPVPTNPVFQITAGAAFVGALDELSAIKSYVTFTITGNLVVEGKFTTTTNITASDKIIGAIYTISSTESTTYCAVDYNTGLDGISGFYEKELIINSYAGYKVYLLDDLSIGDGESVTTNTPAAHSLIIPEDVSLVIMSGGAFSDDILLPIEGRLIVMSGATCNPDVELYQVTSTDEEGDVLYCGFQTALNDAEAGDTIAIVSNVEVANLTIPQGVIVNVEAVLAIAKNLNVAADAELNVTGTLTVGNGSNKNCKVNIYGTVDVSSAAVATFTGVEDYELTIESTGKFVYKATQVAGWNHVLMVGAEYKDGTNMVLTTLANAIEEGATAITIAENYTSSEPIALDGVTMTIAAAKTVSLGAVNIGGGSIVVNAENPANPETYGLLTASIVGIYGEDENVAVVVTGFNGTITDKAKAGVYTMSLEGMLSGSVVVSDGVLDVAAADVTIRADQGLLVGSDAGILFAVNTVIANNGIIDIDGAMAVTDGAVTINSAGNGVFYVDGVLDVEGSLNVTVAGNASTIISGSAIIDGQFATGNLTLLGTMVIDDSESSTASVTLNGNTIVGSSTIGASAGISGKKVTLAANKYIAAYDGAKVDERIVEAATLKSTEFYINDLLYLTAYARAGEVTTVTADATGVINSNTVIIIPGYAMDGLTTITNWANVLGIKFAVAPTVGAAGAEEMYFDGVAGTANVKVSVATGMSIYVDGIKYASGTLIEHMDMGVHTVSVTVNPGYKYADGTTATITFDGKVLSGLLVFDITADMVGETLVLSAIGDIVVDQPDYPEQEKEDNSMIMILLAVLVIMVVILAIVTVIRMMRS